MPVLNLKVSPPVPAARQRALAQALTGLSADILGKKAPLTAVVIDELPAARWFIAGEAAQRPTAFLEIHISAGTNTAGQKAQFVRAAFEELQRQLAPNGELHEVSYVVVHEVPQGDWGYGGVTQHERLAAAPALAA